MYLIRTESGETVEEFNPAFLKFNKNNGTPYGCLELEAQGIEAGGIVYRLIDRDDINERYEKASAEIVDDGCYMAKIAEAAKQNRADIDYIAMMTGIEMEEA